MQEENNEEIYEQLIEKCKSQPVPIPYFSTTEFAEVFINQCATVRTSPGLSRDLSRQHSYEWEQTPQAPEPHLRLRWLPRQPHRPSRLRPHPLAPWYAPYPWLLPVPWWLRRSRPVFPRGTSPSLPSIPRSSPTCLHRKSCFPTRSSCWEVITSSVPSTYVPTIALAIV